MERPIPQIFCEEPSTVDLKNFDEVILELEKIISWSISHNKRLGYFAALYKNITVLIKLAAEKGEFENKLLLEKLDVAFAQRYLDAVNQFREQNLPDSSPWFLVFQTSETERLTIVQHLLLSINVHINYDLPIACAQVGPNEKILTLCNDYFKLNGILSGAIKAVEKGIFQLSPLLSLLARNIPKIERKLLNFSLGVARSRSWECACKQAIADLDQKDNIIYESGDNAHQLNLRIVSPGFFAGIITFFIRVLEVHDIHKNIKVLDEFS